MSIGEDVKKREPLDSIGDNVSCCTYYGKQCEDFSKNLERATM